MATFEKLVTDPNICTHRGKIIHKGISITFQMDTGNWHPDGTPWSACIQADIEKYGDPEQWRYGYSAFGATCHEAMNNAYDWSTKHSMLIPDGWLADVIACLTEHSANVED